VEEIYGVPPVVMETRQTYKSVESFNVKVLGGTFYVSEVNLENGQLAQDLVRTIREIPEDRWFVMASDDDTDHLDSLAIIDDDLEFRIYARGHLEQE